MKVRPLIAPAALLLAACQSAPVTDARPSSAAQPSEWRPSSLSEQTIAKANDTVRRYHQCLNNEAVAHINDAGDPRAVADGILRQCEPTLLGIKAAFDTEQVPPVISERYMRKTRSHGAQQLLRAVLSVHAARVGEEEARAAQNKAR